MDLQKKIKELLINLLSGRPILKSPKLKIKKNKKFKSY